MKRSPGTVGVRELRARLSAYLRAVARGQTVTIGDRRRKPVARLVPFERSADEEALERLAREGLVERGAGKPTSRPVAKRRIRARLVSDIVIEDRG